MCTIKIDAKWVVDGSTIDGRTVSFVPLPTGLNRTFYEFWLRPTPEEFAAKEQYPAGIPLDPKALQYYEALDYNKMEDIELNFRNAEDRQAFIWTYLVTKKIWDDARKEVKDTIEKNRAPDSVPKLPEGVIYPPVPAKNVSVFVDTGMGGYNQSVSSNSTNGSRYDSASESVTSPHNSKFLTAAPPSRQRPLNVPNEFIGG